MSSHGARFALVLALLCALDAGAASPTPPAEEAHVRAALAQLQKRGKRARDWDTFRTERGESAVLVLYVTEAVEPPADRKLEGPPSCPEEMAGVALVGYYHLALFIEGKPVNEVALRSRDDWDEGRLSLPLRNRHWSNYWQWGQGPPVEYGEAGAETEEATKILKLADFNGDGHAWEQRMIAGGNGCGHNDTLLAGYSAKQRRVIVYPIVAGAAVSYWSDNFFPSPYRAAAAHVHDVMQCYDHGNEILGESEYDYNPTLEAWVRTSESSHPCFANDAGPDARPTPSGLEVVVHVGAVQGHPGETVEVAVTIDPNGVDVSDVEIDLPSDNLTFESCTRPAAKWSFADIRAGRWGVHALLSGLGWRQDDRLSRAPLANGSLLFTCRLTLPSEETPASYRMTVSGLRVKSDDSAFPRPARATDGEVVVLPRS